MLILVGGSLTGSFTMLFIMSLMVAAKRGDQQIGTYYQEKAIKD